VEARRGRALVEESREIVVVLDEEDRVVTASRRARELLSGLDEGAVAPAALRQAGTLSIPYEVDGRRETIVYARDSGDMAAYEELRAGFTAAEPWLPIGGDLDRCNVESQRKDPDSMLNFYRRLLEFRRDRACLSVGDYAALPGNECCLAYLRRCGNERLIVILNFSDSSVRITLPPEAHRGRLVLSTDSGRRVERLSGDVQLAGTEGVAIEA